MVCEFKSTSPYCPLSSWFSLRCRFSCHHGARLNREEVEESERERWRKKKKFPWGISEVFDLTDKREEKFVPLSLSRSALLCLMFVHLFGRSALAIHIKTITFQHLIAGRTRVCDSPTLDNYISRLMWFQIAACFLFRSISLSILFFVVSFMHPSQQRA